MTNKVTQTTVNKMSEKYEKHLKSLKEAKELIETVLSDDDVRDNWCGYDWLKELCGELWYDLRHFELSIPSFTEEETEEYEEIID